MIDIHKVVHMYIYSFLTQRKIIVYIVVNYIVKKHLTVSQWR